MQLLNCSKPEDHLGGVQKNALTFGYDDPVQGCVNDCFLIAALSSVAWGSNSRAKLTNGSTVTFYKPTGGTYPSVTTSLTFPMDSTPNLLYARSQGGYHWPLLYEKAYAIKNTNPRTDPPPYSAALNGGDGYNALIELTGFPVRIKKGVEIVNEKKVYTLPNLTDQTIFTDLGSYSGNKTKNAAVAMTRNSDELPPAYNKTLPAGLHPMHTYSILGKYSDGTKNYLVLRNPYRGIIPNPEPTDTAIVARPQALWEGIDLKTADGIFALLMYTFKECFAYYAVVKPTEGA